MGIGALVSVSGSDESGILGTARLSYAMSIDGLFPRLFSRIHPRYHTPSMALIVQGIIAFVLSIFSDLNSNACATYTLSTVYLNSALIDYLG